MRTARLWAVILWCVPVVASAHPVPFSYIDTRIQQGTIEVSVVAHMFDLANDLKLQPPERLLDARTLETQAGAITQLLNSRLQIAADGTTLTNVIWSAPEALPERQSIRLKGRYDRVSQAGRVDVTTLMFPYDPQHKTFLNVYEGG